MRSWRLTAGRMVTASLLAILAWAPASAAPAAPAYGAGVPIGISLFPADNPWNTDVSAYPVDPRSDRYVAAIGASTQIHADFGTTWNGGPNGIPYIVVPGNQPLVPISFYYPDDSDAGPYPIPPDAPVEYGSDHHVVILDTDNRRLYELYDATKVGNGWQAGSGAVFDLTSNALRPDTWTSADAAGLPVLPGLVRYDEVASGVIDHALRFTVGETQRAFIHPATHYASDSTDPNLPPMGLRLRLKASVDIAGFPQPVRVILQALQTYGMFVADNGGPWYISGAPDPRWNDDLLHTISNLQGSDFEVVDPRGVTLPTTTTTTVAALPLTTTTTATPGPPPTTTTTVVADQHPFIDITGDLYRPAIEALRAAGIVSGYDTASGREFRPEATLLRAQFAKMICGTMGVVVTETLRSPFVDLGSDDPGDLYPHQYVAGAWLHGYTRGVSLLEFAPWRPLTRAQAATMIARAARAADPAHWDQPAPPTVPAPGEFDPEHAPDLALLEAHGLTSGLRGYGPTWDPWAPVSRGETAYLLWRLRLEHGSRPRRTVDQIDAGRGERQPSPEQSR